MFIEGNKEGREKGGRERGRWEGCERGPVVPSEQRERDHAAQRETNVFQERIREVGSCSSDAFLCPSHYTPGFRGPEVPLGNLDLPGLVVEGASQSWRGERLFPPLAEDFFSQMNNSL